MSNSKRGGNDVVITPELVAFDQRASSNVARAAESAADASVAAADFSIRAVTANFPPGTGALSVFGDGLDNTIEISRDAAGNIFVNGGDVPIRAGTPTIANTNLIQAFGQPGDDVITLNDADGALPRANLFGGLGNDTITGGSGNDLVFGQAGNDTLLGRGGFDLLFGGADNDVLTGGDGDDQMFGEAGNDRMIWNPGDDNDLMEGGTGVDTAEVNGANGTEVFTVTANGTRVHFDRLEPTPFNIDIGTTENLVVNMNGGDDSFATTGDLAALIRLTVDGGAGNDTILGSNGNDTLLGGDGDDFIDGQQGVDVALMGAGDDLFQWDPGDGSDTVEGQDGVDTMLFNGSNGGEIFEASANGERLLFTRNLGTIVMDTNDVETVELNALGGPDAITVNDLSGTDVAEVAINLAAAGGGDGQADTVAAFATNDADVALVFGAGASVSVSGLAAQIDVAGVEAANDTVTINGLAGDDVIDASGVQAGVVKLVLDGGEGDDIIIGSDGDDVLIGGPGNDVIFGGLGNDVIMGGDGDNIEIEGFVAGASTEDVIDLSGQGFSFEWLMAHSNDVDGSAVLDLGDQAITLRGVSTSALHQDDFLLA